VSGFDDYWRFYTGDPAQDAGGALMARQAAGQGIVNYLQVKSVEEYVTKVEELGGQVLYPKSPVPGVGLVRPVPGSGGELLCHLGER
jgi:predicted enzyme related to lactoylglutathione lyase